MLNSTTIMSRILVFIAQTIVSLSIVMYIKIVPNKQLFEIKQWHPRNINFTMHKFHLHDETCNVHCFYVVS